MFGFLKRFSKKSDSVPAPAVLPPPAPAVAAAPAPPPRAPAPAPVQNTPVTSRTVIPPTSSANYRNGSSAAAAPMPTIQGTVPATDPSPEAPRPLSTETVDIPLRELWTKLNPAVIQTATGHPEPGALLRVPANIIRSQVAKGAVKIPYAQLRQFSPSGLFPTNPAKDTLEVDLPLSEVLPRLKPEVISRRNQRKIEIPDEIGNIFGPGSSAGLRVASEKSSGSAAPAAKAPAAPSVVAPAKSVQSELTKILPQEPRAPVTPTTPNLPATSQVPRAAHATVASTSQTAIPPSPVPPIVPEAPVQAEPIAPVLDTEPIRAPSLDPSLASLRPKPAEEVLPVALMDVVSFWSEKGKTELANLYKHSLEIPMRVLESALKAGKLQFQWREVRTWLRLAPGNSLPTLADDLVVELPLALIAPRFLEHRGIAKPRKRIEPSADIPDLFAQKAAPEVPSTPIVPPAPAEVQKEVAPAVRAIQPNADYPEIFGEPDKKEWTLNDVMRNTASLPGAAGAVLATSDGLLIAGTWPEGVTSEAVAGFLPQMYGRMLQYSKELKLGEPEEFGFNVGDVPLQVFKMNNCYFAVLGRSGKELPKRELAALFLRLKASSNAK